ncbi:MAG: hypothetical protein VYD54_03310, partial [Bdellovibrionota bacterium]|nr:hypothetical protein [Bdellovibrionota bacterium]
KGPFSSIRSGVEINSFLSKYENERKKLGRDFIKKIGGLEEKLEKVSHWSDYRAKSEFRNRIIKKLHRILILNHRS